jgi:hypothetical protein
MLVIDYIDTVITGGSAGIELLVPLKIDLLILFQTFHSTVVFTSFDLQDFTHRASDFEFGWSQRPLWGFYLSRASSYHRVHHKVRVLEHDSLVRTPRKRVR